MGMTQFGRFLAVGVLAAILTAARKPRLTTVFIDAVKFQPADVTLNVGDTVEWINKDPFPHNVTSQDGVFHSRNLEPTQSFRFRAMTPGTFSYVCTLHPTMAAVIHVK
jgi:plastocyanin